MTKPGTQSEHSTDLPARGWTPERQLVFLDRLAHHGNAHAAASAVGLTPQTAYRLRCRDPLFARGWNARAQMLWWPECRGGAAARPARKPFRRRSGRGAEFFSWTV